jgi:hypothetical protein
MTNRADTFEDSTFIIQSFDAKENLIDKTGDPSNFFLHMIGVGGFGSFTVETDNRVNGGTATYKLGFAPVILFKLGYSIEVQFPKQVGMPSNGGEVICDGDMRVIFDVDCLVVSTNTIRIVPKMIVPPVLGEIFTVSIPNIRNPYSSAPSDPF